MATKVQTDKPRGDVLKKIHVNPSTKIKDTNSNMKAGIPIDASSHISPSWDTASSAKESEIDQESLIVDQNLYYPPGNYYGYYYPGFNYYSGDWDEQGWAVENDGAEMQYPATQSGNDGSVVYYMPNYSPYIPYVPGVVFGSDGQYLSHQSYLPNSIFPQPIASPVYFPPPVAYGSEVTPAYQLDPTLYGDRNTVGGYGGNHAVPCSKINFSSTNKNISSIKSTASTKSNSLDNKLSAQSTDVSNNLNRSLKPNTKATQSGSGFSAAAVLAKGYLPVAKFPPSHGKGGLLYSSNSFSVRTTNGGWVDSEKSKSMGKTNSTHDFDLFNEQNRGPRTSVSKNNWVAGEDASTLPCSEDSGSNEKITIISREQFNLPTFQTKYDHAMFFVIKSYSEDDVHKSIKYGVWASTPNGNKRLDNAFVDAQERMKAKGIKCPVFLFFSVNASGQFCGLAEMINRVDFTKNMTFWQQDKWNGFFPVKWHIVKDVPNPQFRHIILENNDNKAVTNSRDTQEVKFPQGIEMLTIFKNYTSKTSVLDDFDFYERRQKAMQDKRTRVSAECPEKSLKPHVTVHEEKIDSLATELQSLELTRTKIGNEDSQLACDVKE